MYVFYCIVFLAILAGDYDYDDYDFMAESLSFPNTRQSFSTSTATNAVDSSVVAGVDKDSSNRALVLPGTPPSRPAPPPDNNMRRDNGSDSTSDWRS